MTLVIQHAIFISIYAIVVVVVLHSMPAIDMRRGSGVLVVFALGIAKSRLGHEINQPFHVCGLSQIDCMYADIDITTCAL